MLEHDDYNIPAKRLKMSFLSALTLSSLAAIFLFLAAVFGIGAAADALINLSLPRNNLFANFIAADLSRSGAGMELILGSIILQLTVILTIAIFALWSFSRKR